MDGSMPSNKEGAKHPEGCQMIGKVPSHMRTSAARRALGNLTSGDKKQTVTRRNRCLKVGKSMERRTVLFKSRIDRLDIFPRCAFSNAATTEHAFIPKPITLIGYAANTKYK